jgi:hypothetical protein
MLLHRWMLNNNMAAILVNYSSYDTPKIGFIAIKKIFQYLIPWAAAGTTKKAQLLTALFLEFYGIIP